MRILLNLESLKTVPQEHFHKQYFTAMHGFLAEIAGKDEKYGKYCFGNLFPIRNQMIEERKDYSVFITSCCPDIIEKIMFSIQVGSLLNLGELQFCITGIHLEHMHLKNNSTIESIAPINITTNENGHIRYHKFNNDNYLMNLQQHLLRKYNFLQKKECAIDLFSNVTISVHEKHPDASFQVNLFNKGENRIFKIGGSKLVFKLNKISDEQLRVFQALFDAGFGERTTYGAGFMVQRFTR